MGSTPSKGSNNIGVSMWEIEKIVSSGDYNRAVVRNHPNRNAHDYVLHHRVAMENHIRRLLSSCEVIHHKNGDKKDNRVENLEILDRASHAKLHGADKSIAYVTLKCPQCNKIFTIEKRRSFLIKKDKDYTSCSRNCGRKFSVRIKKFGRTEEISSAIKRNLIE